VTANGKNALKGSDLVKGLPQFADLLDQTVLEVKHAAADLDPGTQFSRIPGLGQVIIGSRLQPFNDVTAFVPGGQHDQIRRLIRLIGTDVPDYPNPV